MALSHFELIALGALLFGALAHFIYTCRRAQTTQPTSPTQHAEKTLGPGLQPPVACGSDVPRRWGEWVPHKLDYPRFEPDTTFDVKTTKPPPYRAFRWGPKYNITMGVRSMDWSNWIELDNRYTSYHAIRTHRTLTRGARSVRTLPGAEAAAREACTEIAEYLSRRHPTLFRVTRASGTGGWYGEGEIDTIELDASLTLDGKAVRYDLRVDDPMSVAGRIVQDDLAVMMENEEGDVVFMAGSICTAGFWRLEDKIGLPLEEIHTRGNVPQYKEKLHKSMTRFFQRIRIDKPVVRNNYFMQIDNELTWSETTNGNENIFDQYNKAPLPELLQGSQFRAPEPTDDPASVRFRTERQSLRRLPKTGAVLFTIRTYLEPIGELVKEPGVPGRMASAIRSWPEDVSLYKGGELYNDVLLPYLDEQHKAQVEAGVWKEDDQTQHYPW